MECQNKTHPMPRIDELIVRSCLENYISTLDLTQGYWQVPLVTGTWEKTAFCFCYSGQYQFSVMSFGFPPVVHGTVDKWLISGIEDDAGVYIDDLVI